MSEPSARSHRAAVGDSGTGIVTAKHSARLTPTS